MDNNEIKSDKVLDTRGLQSPMQILKIKTALKTMTSGHILEIWDSDPNSQNEIPASLSEGIYQYMGSTSDPEGYTRYYIKKG